MTARLELVPAGKSLEVGDDETVLDAAIRAGLNLPHSCRGGSCQSCRARIVAGAVSYDEGRPRGLSDADEEAGYALLCQARPATGTLVVEVSEMLPSGAPGVRRLPVRVERMERLDHDVMALYLKTPPVDPLRFVAGQYVDIIQRDGHRRAFSIANAPREDFLLELHVRRVPGGNFTEHVFERMKVKDLLRIEGPLGAFFLRDESVRPILMMAGGTGFAPLKAILEHAFGDGCTRPIHLFWGIRTRRDLYMRELVDSWVREHECFRFTPVLSEPEAADGADARTGWVHEALLEDYPDLSGHDVYMSGPPPMVAAGQAAFPAHGLSREHLYFDSFEFAPEVQRALEKAGITPR